MNSKSLSLAELAALVRDLNASGTSVVAPVPTRSLCGADYRPITELNQATLNGALPRRSLKELFLPASEVLLRYRLKKNDVELLPVPTTFTPQVILGARPCDAAGVAVLDRVMGWDYRDELWFGRRAATTIVSLACPGFDGVCFCHAVGLNPDASLGSDVLLVPRGADAYWAMPVTDKGEALLARGTFADLVEPAEVTAFRKAAEEKVAKNLASLPSGFHTFMAQSFDHPEFKAIASRCHGCGACAAVCPTCHCFDIVDEPEGMEGGARRRNWDFCATCKFTVHASGHNPRATQNERFRQRVMHKFSIYPQRFDAVLCTGCGRCVRACPAGMDLPEVLGHLYAAQAAGGVS